MSKLKWTPDESQSTFIGPSRPEVILHWYANRRLIECGKPAPDPIIQKGRFCRTRRQDDRQTAWLHDKWLRPVQDDPDTVLLRAVIFRVCINDFRVAREITAPSKFEADDAKCYVDEMRARAAEGLPTEHYGHHAYTIFTYPGFKFKPEGHARCLLAYAWKKRAEFRFQPDDTIEKLYHRLMTLPGIGTFYAGQIVADLKFWPPWSTAPDVMTFAAPGPNSVTGGSRAGLARVLGKPAGYYNNRDTLWDRDHRQLYEAQAPEIAEIIGERPLRSDHQSAVCEVQKFERYRIDRTELQIYEPYDPVALPPRKRLPARSTKSVSVKLPTAPLTTPPIAHAIPELHASRDPTAPHVLHHDLETCSELAPDEVGAHRYATHSSTFVWCLAYAVDDELVQLWTPGEPIPPEFIEAARNPNWTLVAHNDQFERLIFRRILGPRYGYPLVPIARRHCSLAMARAASLPGKLGVVAKALALEHQKDKAGEAVMRRMAHPLPDGTPIDDPQSRELLYRYCAQDVRVERELHQKLPPLAPAEHQRWQLDAAINDRGFFVDHALLETALHAGLQFSETLATEFCGITGAEYTQIGLFRVWLEDHNCPVTDTQKGTLKAATRRKDLAPEVRRAIQLRLELAHDPLVKIKGLLARRESDGRVRGAFNFHGAGTGRWSSLGVNVHNFRRDAANVDAKIAAVMNGGDEND
jgi:DNA polymerase